MEVNEATKDIERKARLVNKQLVEETKISAVDWLVGSSAID
jgi:hypothetical protein